MMNGIDISSYQRGLDLKKVPADFVIIKATEGTAIVQNTCDPWVQECIRQGKPWGFYHFSGGGDPVKEADWFVDHTANYFGHGLPIWDYESYGAFGTDNAKKFLDRVFERTGVRCVVYTNRSIVKNEDWSKIAPNHPLWVAQYANYAPVHGYQENPWLPSGGFGAWKSPIIHQYTSQGYLPGYSKNLDLDKCYITADEWESLCKGHKVDEKPKTVDELAREVLDKKWGDGADRKKRLTEAGYDYKAVQNRVNELLGCGTKTVDELAREVLDKKWGDGADRKKRLTEAGYDYKAVQNRVNELLGYGKKSIDQLAREVIAGEWGDGEDRKRELTKHGYDYHAVQKRVNELMG